MPHPCCSPLPPPAILVRRRLPGSSLGGWVALRLAQQVPERVTGLMLINPAVNISLKHWAVLPSRARR